MTDSHGRRRMNELIQQSRAELVPTDHGDTFFIVWPVFMAALWSDAKKAAFVKHMEQTLGETGIRWIATYGIDTEDITNDE
jgi:hypothetical protein